jgi:dTDP-4-dehydrorhamnose 3,5-epimerase
MSDRGAPADRILSGEPDPQTVTSDWMPIEVSSIDGVVTKEIRNVLTGSGALTEIWRSAWQLDGLPVDQVFQRWLNPGAVTGWHAHGVTTDRLFCSAGTVRISLFDGRRSSPTARNIWHRTIGAARPTLIVIPPGVWHGVKSIGPDPALVLNLVDRAYGYEAPDHWRLPPDTPDIPYSLRRTEKG